MSLEQSELGFEAGEALGGFRLYRFELLNWGTFDKKIHVMALNGENTLLTGEIGSGKSTIVDAITTLLVPPQQLAFNKAAGAETKERTLRSYVEGWYKTAKEDEDATARRVGLRRGGSYSVLLGYFCNQALNAAATLAQVFWVDEGAAQPARFYAFAERDLSIKEDFSDFGGEIKVLRKRLRDAGVEVCDSYKEYHGKFMRAFGIRDEQAINLFNQTVSMKTVGNLTGFVRAHILEKFDVAEKIQGLLAHFDDLKKAHAETVKARAQIELLSPMREEGKKYSEAEDELKSLKAERDALDTWLSVHKARLLEERLILLEREAERLKEALAASTQAIEAKQHEIESLAQAILGEGGGRMETLEREIESCKQELERRKKRADAYSAAAAALSVNLPQDANEFVENRARLVEMHARILQELERIDNSKTETAVKTRRVDDNIAARRAELESLRARKTNIEAASVDLRSRIARALAIDEEELPFAGELIAVRKEEARWEGAAERLLRNFALSLLVPEGLYKKVSGWVDENNLKGRLVYFRVSQAEGSASPRIAPRTLAAKLELKEDSPLYTWLRREVAARFDHICCDTMDEFRREQKAVTASGQSKQSGMRHEKDDRHSLHDRSRYVLGWNNARKISLLEKEERDLREEAAALAAALAELKKKRQENDAMLASIAQLSTIEAFAEIDWQTASRKLSRLQEEMEELKASSQKLKMLKERQAKARLELEAARAEYAATLRRQGANEEEAKRSSAELEAERANATDELLAFHGASFARLEARLAKDAGLKAISLENCEKAKRAISESLARAIDGAGDKIKKIEARLTRAMHEFKAQYMVETQDITADMASLPEYLALLDRLEKDDLPRFEARFNQMLKQKTIEEIVSFHAELEKSGRDIKERIGYINEALEPIEYNPARYIELVLERSADSDIRQFQADLRECTRDASASESKEYTAESRFAAIEKLLARFRGRPEFSAEDKRWTEKVTDVRNWFTFAASERYREDGKEAEHYSDSSGKSGGQKEKLAYTILAAGLAYQYGLNAGVTRARTFRFVMIDEAFARGSDESARYALELFSALKLQLLIVTPRQKIHVIEPFVSAVAFVSNRSGNSSHLTNMTIEEYREQKKRRALDNAS